MTDNETPKTEADGSVERRVRPRAWWRLSIYAVCDPVVTVREEEAEFWRSEGLEVFELGDVAAERERCAKLVEDANAWRGGHGEPPKLSGKELADLIRKA